MGLTCAQKTLGLAPHALRHPAAIFRDIGGIVAGSDAAVESAVNAVGYAAMTRKKGVTQAGNGREQRRSELHEGLSLASCSSPANPTSEVRRGSETASTFNMEPMPPRPPPISRFRAPRMASETPGGALPLQVAAPLF